MPVDDELRHAIAEALRSAFYVKTTFGGNASIEEITEVIEIAASEYIDDDDEKIEVRQNSNRWSEREPSA